MSDIRCDTISIGSIIHKVAMSFYDVKGDFSLSIGGPRPPSLHCSLPARRHSSAVKQIRVERSSA